MATAFYGSYYNMDMIIYVYVPEALRGRALYLCHRPAVRRFSQKAAYTLWFSPRENTRFGWQKFSSKKRKKSVDKRGW